MKIAEAMACAQKGAAQLTVVMALGNEASCIHDGRCTERCEWKGGVCVRVGGEREVSGWVVWGGERGVGG